MKKIVIAGGSGFLGKALEKYFSAKYYTVQILTRNPKKFNHLKWDAKNLGTWTECLENTDVLINLTGKSVDCRYNEKNKNEILNSRIDSTKILNEAVANCKNKPKVFLNSSSATIYNHSLETLNTEKSKNIGNDFSMNVCKAWEKEFFSTTIENVRKVALRIAIVFGNEGGAFPKLKQITKLGLGGRQGKGNQKVSWIHIDDFCSAIDFILNENSLENVVNVCAPNPLSNFEFMKTNRNKLKAKIGLPSPKFLLEIGAFFMRTETELLLKSRNVFPEKLINKGFIFKYEQYENAVDSLVN